MEPTVQCVGANDVIRGVAHWLRTNPDESERRRLMLMLAGALETEKARLGVKHKPDDLTLALRWLKLLWEMFQGGACKNAMSEDGELVYLLRLAEEVGTIDGPKVHG